MNKMKKTYISPEMLTVQLGTVHMIADSLRIFTSGSGSEQTITNDSQILTKENRDVNLWDNEW